MFKIIKKDQQTLEIIGRYARKRIYYRCLVCMEKSVSRNCCLASLGKASVMPVTLGMDFSTRTEYSWKTLHKIHHILFLTPLLGSKAKTVLAKQMCCILTKMYRLYRKMTLLGYTLQPSYSLLLLSQTPKDKNFGLRLQQFEIKDGM